MKPEDQKDQASLRGQKVEGLWRSGLEQGHWPCGKSSGMRAQLDKSYFWELSNVPPSFQPSISLDVTRRGWTGYLP